MKNITALLITVSALTLTACTKEDAETTVAPLSLNSSQIIVEKYETDDKAWHKLQDELREQAKTREEYTALKNEKLGDHPDINPALEASLNIAEQSPESADGFAALKFIAEQTRGMDDRAQWLDKAFPYLTAHHLTKPEMLDLQYKLTRSYYNDATGFEAFMQALATQNPDPIIQANTWYNLASIQYKYLNGPSVSDTQRTKNTASTLSHLDKARNTQNYSQIDIYSPRRKARGLDPKKLSEIIDPLAFAVEYLSIGSQIPNVKMKNMSGQDDQILNYRDKIVLLDFWGTWCGPCIASIPELVDMKNQYGGDFEILSFAYDEKLSDVTEFQEDTDMPWAHWFVGKGKDTFIKDWYISAFPTYILIDKKGEIQLITNEMTSEFKIKIEELL